MSRKSFSTLFFAIKPFRMRGVAGGVIYFVHGARAVISVLRLGLLIASHRAPVVHHSTGRAPSTGSRTFHRRDDTAVDRVSRVAYVGIRAVRSLLLSALSSLLLLLFFFKFFRVDVILPSFSR